MKPPLLDFVRKVRILETKGRFLIIGQGNDEGYRLLKIERPQKVDKIVVVDDGIKYTKSILDDIVVMLEGGNKAHGGISRIMDMVGIIGFVEIVKGRKELVVIKKRKKVAQICGYWIFQAEEIDLIPILRGRFSFDELKLRTTFVESVLKSVYFSYSYDISVSFQENVLRAREDGPARGIIDDTFVWNAILIQGLPEGMDDFWIIPIVHGFVKQEIWRFCGRILTVILIARRSRHNAGTRFNRRGIDTAGHAANDVETEQILGTGSLMEEHTSYVQMRGSIPLFWAQDNSLTVPKPPVKINLFDPFFTSTRKHFDILLERYGNPVIIMNLLKQKERKPREQLLLWEYRNAYKYMKEFYGTKVQYLEYDYHHRMKEKVNVFYDISQHAQDLFARTSFFRVEDGRVRLQNGVVRVNCLDSLDRTNVAQFMIGLHVFTEQLKLLRVIFSMKDDLGLATPSNTASFAQLARMYIEMGDEIALQYAGSHALHAISQKRKDIFLQIRRYYSNTFVDKERQVAFDHFMKEGEAATIDTIGGNTDVEGVMESCSSDEVVGAELGTTSLSETGADTESEAQTRDGEQTEDDGGIVNVYPRRMRDDKTFWMEGYQDDKYTPIRKLSRSVFFNPIKVSMEGVVLVETEEFPKEEMDSREKAQIGRKGKIVLEVPEKRREEYERYLRNEPADATFEIQSKFLNLDDEEKRRIEYEEYISTSMRNLDQTISE